MKAYEVVDSDGNVILETDDGCEAYALKNLRNNRLPYNMHSVFVRKNLGEHSAKVGMGITAYRFWFKDGGYAFYYVDEDTGVFQIFSDWGNYSYCWPQQCRSRGEGLLAFLKTADKYYLTEKLTMGIPERREFSMRKTLAYIKYLICEKRRGGRLDSDKARELWTWASELVNRYQVDTDHELFDLIKDHEDFTTYIEEDVSELFVYERSESLMFLRESLIPFFKNYIKDTPND